MTENQNQPREYDAVLGGQSQLPLGAAVLGGIPGVKCRLASPIVEVKIAALSEALKYGEAGLDLIIGVLQDESMAVKLAAFSLLKDRDELNLKEQLHKYLPTFEFDVITVDAEGQENSRHTSSARFFPEDLGNGVVLEMVYIPGGTFMMGSPATESGRDDERPQHQVTVPAFYAGKYPITQAQWQAVMGNNPSDDKGEKRPVETVGWYHAVEFCGKLSQQTGKKYRLLSEAEWEYACRAGTTTQFHFGETITPDLVNYDGNLPYANVPKGLYRRETTDVGSFPPNNFGVYDMHGNVMEWCSDRWHENYNDAPTDGSSWETGTDDCRVQRGGSWYHSAVYCGSHLRDWCWADYGGWHRGFRVALASVSPSS
ncbi:MULTISPECIES: formylglycine-generating enzyme family protein [unclassified Microcoleus]|uniref:formylglycine-generating enzyme family protein n=1 Tax=unclassified Microcoleus TaxID=2642155 RepID=UPI002FD45FD8